MRAKNIFILIAMSAIIFLAGCSQRIIDGINNLDPIRVYYAVDSPNVPERHVGAAIIWHPNEFPIKGFVTNVNIPGIIYEANSNFPHKILSIKVSPTSGLLALNYIRDNRSPWIKFYSNSGAIFDHELRNQDIKNLINGTYPPGDIKFEVSTFDFIDNETIRILFRPYIMGGQTERDTLQYVSIKYDILNKRKKGPNEYWGTISRGPTAQYRLSVIDHPENKRMSVSVHGGQMWATTTVSNQTGIVANLPSNLRHGFSAESAVRE